MNLALELEAIETALGALVEVNSFTGNPEGGNRVATLLESLFNLPGLQTERIASRQGFADHLVIRTIDDRGQAPTALVGHLDTVFPPGKFESGYQKEGDLRRGPGVLDMKGGLVVIAFALKRLIAEPRPLPALRIVVVSDEEVGSPEGQPIIQRAVAGAREALVFESGRVQDAIITRRKGTGGLTARAQGRAAHAGNNHADGANALVALSRFVVGASSLTDYAAGTTINVGQMVGGQGKNTVPDEGRAELDLRVMTQAAAEALMKALNREAEQASAAVPGTRIKLEGGLLRLPMERTAATGELLKAYAQSAQAAGLGFEESPTVFGGGSDANTTSAMGIPSIDGLGPRGKGFHTLDEQIEFSSMQPKIAALAGFLRNRVSTD
jgi:glutamate carboxypeptidase